jgi:hypothetical protein
MVEEVVEEVAAAAAAAAAAANLSQSPRIIVASNLSPLQLPASAQAFSVFFFSCFF